MNKFNVGDRVRHHSTPAFGLGTVKGYSPKYPDMLVVEFEKPTGTGHDGDGLGRMDHCWRTSLIGCFVFVKAAEPAKPTIKVFVGSHVRHLEHPQYGNGRVRFVHPNGISLAVEFENATNLDHDCAGHTKVNHGRWTKAGSLELVEPFKVGDTVLMCDVDQRLSDDNGWWYSEEFAGRVGTVVGVMRPNCVDVSVQFAKHKASQYVHINDLTLVKVDPVEAVKKATPKVRTFKKGSQCDRIVKFLLAGNSITPLKARQLFGAERLAARILEIRQAGHKVVATVKTDLNGKVYGEYSLRNVGRVWA